MMKLRLIVLNTALAVMSLLVDGASAGPVPTLTVGIGTTVGTGAATVGPIITGPAPINMVFANPELRDCLFADNNGASDCAHAHNQTPSNGALPGYALKLFKSTDANAVEITGRYNLGGGKCTGSSQQCPFLFSASFVPFCAQTSPGNFPSNCPQATRVKIYYRMEQDQLNVQGVPMMPTFDTSSGTGGVGPVEINVPTLMTLATTSVGCPAGQTVQGVNPDGTPLCLEDPVLAMAKCETQKAMLQTTGGVTDKCSIPVMYLRLVGNVHTHSECMLLGGTLVSGSGQPLNLTFDANSNHGILTYNGSPVGAWLYPSLNQALFCKAAQANCFSNWSQHLNWSETTAKNCGNILIDRGPAVINNAWNACTSATMIQNKCGFGNPVTVSGHNWNNTPQESQSYNTQIRICYAGGCGDHVCYDNAAGNTYIDCDYNGTSQSCVADRTAIGCK